MRVEVIERAVRFLTTFPAAFVHPLDLLVSTSRSLLLMRAWDRDKGIDSREWNAALQAVSTRSKERRSAKHSRQEDLVFPSLVEVHSVGMDGRMQGEDIPRQVVARTYAEEEVHSAYQAGGSDGGEGMEEAAEDR